MLRTEDFILNKLVRKKVQFSHVDDAIFTLERLKESRMPEAKLNFTKGQDGKDYICFNDLLDIRTALEKMTDELIEQLGLEPIKGKQGGAK